MTLPSNPYIAGDPVSGQDRFIGRTDVLRDVLRALRNPNANAIVLYGQRRIGKTSVLLQLERDLASGGEYTPVYLDLQDKAALPLDKVLYQLAQRITSVVGASAPQSDDFDPAGDYFRDAFLPGAAQQAAGKSLVLLFDEFDVLDLPQQGQAGAAFFPYLRSWMSDAQRVQFVFVLGRRPEDLSTDTLSAFKAVPSRQVSLMDRANSEAIIRQSERNGSLEWLDEGVERVWHWTRGHPYFTQLLCSEVWEAAYDQEPDEPPSVGAAGVNAALDKAMEQGANAFLWIWNGLPAAERVVMAAMAEAGEGNISQDDLTTILYNSGVRLILRDLDLAPETMVRWDLLRPVEGGYRFAVLLLRRWVAANKPLGRVKAELDTLEPLAENLYRSAEGMYNLGDLTETERLLRNALNSNPNHFRARLMLGRVLLGQGNPTAAVEALEPAYEFDPPAAQSGLIAALLALVEGQDEAEQLQIYERVLKIDPEQPVALEKRRAIWLGWAEAAIEQDDLNAALNVYQQLGDQDGVTRVREMRRKRELDGQLTGAKKHEEAEDWSSAIEIYERLLEEFPDEGDWQQRLESARVQARLAEKYGRAVNALQEGNGELAQRLLGEVIGTNPAYKEAARYLLLATPGVDLEALRRDYRIFDARQRATQRRQVEQEKAPPEGESQGERKEPQRVQPVLKELRRPSRSSFLERWWEKWLVSTLTWWPLLALVSWSLLNNRLELDSSLRYGCLVAIGLDWLLTGLFGGTDKDSGLEYLMLIAALVVALVVTGIVVVNVVDGMVLVIVFAVVSIISGGVAWGITGGAKSKVAGSAVVLAMVVSVALVVAASVAASVAGGGLVGIGAGIVAGYMGSLGALTIATIIANGVVEFVAGYKEGIAGEFE